MLVLTRRLGEEIVIDGEIRLKVLAIKGKLIRLGITAPPAVHIARLELLTKGLNGSSSPVVSNARQER